jgi:glycosyltransferase involved in cell wall biosynthesis
VQGTVAFILKGYPRISESFIAQEIRALERRGIDIIIVSLRHPTDRYVHTFHSQIRASVLYLPEYLWRGPLRTWRAWRAARRRPSYREARRVWLRDLVRDRSPNRIRRFGQALVMAREIPVRVSHLHAHFLHTPASVARYASLLTGLPWSCSAHAKDIWTSPNWEMAEKLADCRWAVTCTAAGRDHLAALAPPGRVQLAYHGIDISRFPFEELVRPARDGVATDDPVIILSVGRAVAKKGYDDLVSALAALPKQLSWRFIHIGEGPLLATLQRKAHERGLNGRVRWLRAQPDDVVLDQYRAADLFVLASRIADDGDRDGLPNVLVEAQSQGLAVIATRTSAIPELIEDGVTGCLVEPRDHAALTAALAHLIANPAQRERLGRAGQARVREEFSMNRSIDLHVAKFATTD